jgi:hypothetical protein
MIASSFFMMLDNIRPLRSVVINTIVYFTRDDDMNCLRIFVTEDFHDFMTASKLSEKDILKSAHELANGLFDADLSGNVYKKRIAP